MKKGNNVTQAICIIFIMLCNYTWSILNAKLKRYRNKYIRGTSWCCDWKWQYKSLNAWLAFKYQITIRLHLTALFCFISRWGVLDFDSWKLKLDPLCWFYRVEAVPLPPMWNFFELDSSHPLAFFWQWHPTFTYG